MGFFLNEAIFLVDIGNTNIVFSISDGLNSQLKIWRIPTDKRATPDSIRTGIYGLLQQDQPDAFTKVSVALVASVVPVLTNQMITAIKTLFKGKKIILLNDEKLTIGIDVNIDIPQQAGVDRILNALAVKNEFDLPAIVVDFGTATTFDVVSFNGEFIGGVIMPGPSLSLFALQKIADHLPMIEMNKPNTPIGKSTVHAMESGFYWGYTGSIERIIMEISGEIGKEIPTLIFTGGLGEIFSNEISMKSIYDKGLTLRGMLYAFKFIETRELNA